MCPQHPAVAQPDHRQGRDHRVLERVARDDAELGHALGPRVHDVVLLQGLEHLGAVDAHDRGERREAEGDRRQHRVGERVAEDPPVAAQDRVDDEQVRDRRGWGGHEAQAAPERQDPELESQEELQHQPEPEGRDRDARDRDDARELVDPRVGTRPRGSRREHRARSPGASRPSRFLEGSSGVTRRDQPRPFAGPQRASEVTERTPSQILAELDGQRAIEPVLGADRLDHRGRRVRSRGEPRRVARRHVRDHERDAEQTEQHEAQQKNPPGEVAEQPYLAAIASG